MKNKKLWFGILAMTLVFGMALVGCVSDAGTKDVPITGVTLNKSSLTLAVGGTETLTTTVSPSDAKNKAVTWSTSDATKATVVNGTVTAVAPGSATITVTTADGGKTATCTVTVTGHSLDGIWETANGFQVTVSGSTGVYSAFGTTTSKPVLQDAINKNYIKVGDQYWKNLTSTGTLTWSGQGLLVQYYTTSPNVAIGTTWGNYTFTMSADGQTLTLSGDGNTWTRKQ